jgi:hypothetical protein
MAIAAPLVTIPLTVLGGAYWHHQEKKKQAAIDEPFDEWLKRNATFEDKK